MSNATDDLAEALRCQYLEAMGVQTWFDPTLLDPALVSIDSELDSPAESSGLSHIDQHQKAPLEGVPLDGVSVDDTPVDDALVTGNKPHVGAPSSSVSLEAPTSAPAPQQAPIEVAASIGVLNNTIKQCQLCELHTLRQHAISGEGDAHANVLILIDAPVSDELGEHALFNVQDKHMLGAMLHAIGLSLSSVYITSLVKCKPSEQRAPYTSEVICCDGHLSAQINVIEPQVILVLGEKASQQLLVSQKPLMDLRLRQHQHLGVPVFASYHPSECFASPDTKRKVWADLLQILKQFQSV